MANRQIMLKALKKYTFPVLMEQGFTGKHPNFRRKLDNCIELITFQTNKWGGSFTIEVSAVFPESEQKNYTLYEGVTEETLGVEATNYRYRLPGMFDGWFYYRDVYFYKMRIGFFGRKNITYVDIPEKDSESFVPPQGYDLIQKFDENAAAEICNEINRQFEKAYAWLEEFEAKHKK